MRQLNCFGVFEDCSEGFGGFFLRFCFWVRATVGFPIAMVDSFISIPQFLQWLSTLTVFVSIFPRKSETNQHTHTGTGKECWGSIAAIIDIMDWPSNNQTLALYFFHANYQFWLFFPSLFLFFFDGVRIDFDIEMGKTPIEKNQKKKNLKKQSFYGTIWFRKDCRSLFSSQNHNSRCRWM